MARTIVYIDGFNLYYRALKPLGHKWMNIDALSEAVLPASNRIAAIKYYTARVSGRIDPGAPARQHAYLRALESLPRVTIHYGNFLTGKKWAGLVHPPQFRPVCTLPPGVVPQVAYVWKTEEKGSDVNLAIPEVVVRKFERAQKLYVLTWLDFDLIKGGELVAMTALELALTDRYAGAETERRRKLVAGKAEKERRKISKSEKWWTEYVSFADLLKYMVERDGLTEEQIPMNARCGAPSKVIGRLTGEAKQLLPQEAERLISEILRACGHEVMDQGFIEGDTGVDCHFQTEIDGRRQRIAVEIKFTRRRPRAACGIRARLTLGSDTGGLRRRWLFLNSLERLCLLQSSAPSIPEINQSVQNLQ